MTTGDGMNRDIARALMSMGYRRRVKKGQEKGPGNGVWVKPIAHMCFVFSEAEMRWYNMFVGLDAKTHCWNSQEFKPVESAGTHVQQLKDFENDTRTDVRAGTSEFEFLGLQEALDLDLECLGVS